MANKGLSLIVKKFLDSCNAETMDASERLAFDGISELVARNT